MASNDPAAQQAPADRPAAADPAEVQRNANVLRAESLFYERMAQERIVSPAEDSAKSYLRQLLSSEPSNPGTQVALLAFKERTLFQAQTAAHHHDYGVAEGWLKEAADAGADPARISGIEADIHEQQAAATPSVASSPLALGATLLKLTQYVKPTYPSAAIDRALTGYVVVQFTVNPDGTTTDVTVAEAVPPRIFNQAAIDAVRKWRYEPFQGEGLPTNYKVTFRLSANQP